MKIAVCVKHVPELEKLGVARVFTPGSPTHEIVDFIRSAVEGR